MKQAHKILFLGANAGGGHMSNAYSLQAWVKEYFPDKETLVSSTFDHLPKFFGRDPVSLFYYVLSVHAPTLWKRLIDTEHKKKPAEIDRTFLRLAPLLGKNKVMSFIESYNPDLIISTYAPLVSPLQKELVKRGSKIPVKLVITDIFSAPPYWLAGTASEYVVMSDMAYQKVHTALPDKSIQKIPPVLHPKFFTKQASSSLSHQPGTQYKILVLAGGEGVYHLNDLVELLADMGHEIVVVCGKDRSAKAELEYIKNSLSWEHVTIYGFIDTIEKELSECDLVITKAGPATLFEIWKYKKPVICYHYIYGTEQENIEYMLDNNLGLYESNIQKIPQLVQSILHKKIILNTIEVLPVSKQDIAKLLEIKEQVG